MPCAVRGETQRAQLRRVWGWLVLAASAAGGCGGEVPVDSDIPAPLVPALPLRMGVLYDDEFRNYSYTEKLIDGPEWTIDLGNANVTLFEQTLSSAFSDVVAVTDLPAGAANPQRLDAVIRPKLDEYAFLTPRDSGVDFYSVSIRYLVELYDRDGTLLSSWPINAYGRARAKTMNAKESLADATELAMRDAAAALAVDFREREPVRALLARGSDR